MIAVFMKMVEKKAFKAHHRNISSGEPAIMGGVKVSPAGLD